jgi:hypothetical protein
MHTSIPSKEEVRARQRVQYSSAIDAFRKKCVDALNSRYECGSQVTLSLAGVARPVYETVAAEFRTKGWRVTVQHDQREGDYLTID